MEPSIEIAAPADLPGILALQKLAFRGEAQRYRDFNIPQLTQSLAELEAEYAAGPLLKLEVGGVLVGSIRGRRQDGVGQINRLFVHPDWQGGGLGSRLLGAMEGQLSDCRRFRLFTGHLSGRNLAFYARRGYREVRRETLSERVTLVWLEKLNLCPSFIEKG